MEDRDTALAGDLDVLVGAAGLAGQALHRIAVLQEAVRRSSAPAPRCGERAEHDAVRLRAELAALFESPLEPLDAPMFVKLRVWVGWRRLPGRCIA